MTPGQAAAALADLAITETLSAALATEAASLADAVRANLASPAGGSHDQPWCETGSLQGSIALSTEGLAARIGSNDPAAAPQELGTTRVPPRPFFAPAATAAAEPIARTIGQVLANTLARRLT